ncbi:ROK family transcriptional regulator [Rhizobium skierniewicense]|uniref:ROK family transcriptional regulator n=1 Tax=Rhizobium skierniewicense TaxID=984260 RepID=UPI0015720569|nr:ROK family transcriptional regulator [Rhizobium skierniewicense]NTF32679.1 ROK family transcriptional regulator [Rhizobium skierniewicense]
MSGIASTELVRQQNSLRVLSALRRHGNLSHTELAGLTGLASATVSAITADLERFTLIERTEQQAASGRGRPRVLFQPNRHFGYVAVVVISSDAVQYSLVDFTGMLMDRFGEPRTSGKADDFALLVLSGLLRLVARSKIMPSAVLHISISSKGLVDPASATLVWSPVLGEGQVDFRQVLSSHFSARIYLYNEALLVAEALWMRQRSETPPTSSLAALSLGHSIGLGVARDVGEGRAAVDAPNFGHMLHLPDGALCRCGARGCVEAYCGFYGILRTAFEVPTNTIPAKFVPLAEVDKIAASARSGNRMAAFAFRQAGLALGNGLSRLFSLHGPMRVFVTGPGTRFFDLLKTSIQDGMKETNAIRIGGMPQITIEPDEQSLVFDGHMGLALSRLDGDILTSGTAAAQT